MIVHCVNRVVRLLSAATLAGIGGREELQSIAAMALLRAARAWDDKDEAKFSTFACICIRRQLLGLAQKFRALPITEFHDDDGQNNIDAVVPSGAPEPIDQAAQLEDVAAVHKLLARLTPRQRLIIYLRFWEGRTLQYVAWRLGISGERARQIEDVALAKMRWVAERACSNA